MLITYILEKFPKLTETFVWNEINELNKRGIKIKVLAVDGFNDSLTNQLQIDGVDVIYFTGHFSVSNIAAHFYFLFTLNLRYLAVLFNIIFKKRRPVYLVLTDLKAFSVGVYFLFNLKNTNTSFFYSHFINFPTSIAVYMSQLSGTPFSCSAHANDIYMGHIQDIRDKVKQSMFVMTCTLANKDYLQSICDNSFREKIIHNYHGIDGDKWSFRNFDPEHLSSPRTCQILSVARLVEKKGIRYLIDAVRILVERGFLIQCTIIGDGPLANELKELATAHKIGAFVDFKGECPYNEIKQAYADSDCFVLPCLITPEGDRDGLPNVLLEAMSSGIPIVTTSVSAISELILHENTGLIVPVADANGIADAVVRLLQDHNLYKQLIENGRKKIKQFNIANSADNLVRVFNETCK